MAAVSTAVARRAFPTLSAAAVVTAEPAGAAQAAAASAMMARRATPTFEAAAAVAAPPAGVAWAATAPPDWGGAGGGGGGGGSAAGVVPPAGRFAAAGGLAAAGGGGGAAGAAVVDTGDMVGARKEDAAVADMSGGVDGIGGPNDGGGAGVAGVGAGGGVEGDRLAGVGGGGRADVNGAAGPDGIRALPGVNPSGQPAKGIFLRALWGWSRGTDPAVHVALKTCLTAHVWALRETLLWPHEGQR